jgi:hypothetical protein
MGDFGKRRVRFFEGGAVGTESLEAGLVAWGLKILGRSVEEEGVFFGI